MDVFYLFLCILLASGKISVNQIPSYGYPSQQSLYSTISSNSHLIYTFGGTDGKDYSNKLTIFNLETSIWTEMIPSSDSIPSARINSLSFIYNDTFYIYGGQTKTSLKNDLWSYNISTNIWTSHTQTGSIPSPRIQSSLVLSSSSLYLFGGDTSSGPSTALFHLDLVTLTWTWTVLIPEGKLRSRSGHAMIEYNSKLIIWGGSSSDTTLAEIDLLTLAIQEKPLKGETITMQSFPFSVFQDQIFVLPGFSAPMQEPVIKCMKIDLTQLEISEFSCEIFQVYSAYSSFAGFFYIFGGFNDQGIRNDLVQINLSKGFNVNVLTPHTLYPKARMMHSCVPTRNFFWLYGGCSDNYR